MAEQKPGLHDIRDWQATKTKEELRETARKAGRASVEARRKSKPMKDIIKTMLVLDTVDEDLGAYLTKLGLEPTNENAMILRSCWEAIKGDAEMLRFIRDTKGEKPTDALSVTLDKPIAEMDLTQLSTEELAELTQKVADAE